MKWSDLFNITCKKCGSKDVALGMQYDLKLIELSELSNVISNTKSLIICFNCGQEFLDVTNDAVYEDEATDIMKEHEEFAKEYGLTEFSNECEEL